MRNSTTKPRRSGDETLAASRREEILDAAARLFARHGYADTDTQLLADELGVGKGTLYRYFPSKRDLFLATVDRVMRELCREIDACFENSEDPLKQMASAFEAYLTYFAERPEAVELLMQERAQFKDRKKPTYFEYREANAERWRALWRSLIAQGRVRDMPVDTIRDAMSNLLYGTMFTNYFAGQDRPPREQARELLDVAFHGVLSDAERRRSST